MSEERIIAWHFLPGDRRLRYAPRTLVEIGETISHEGKLEVCKLGLHASIRPIDAVCCTPTIAIIDGWESIVGIRNLIACRVECWGDIQHEDDKFVCRNRRAIKMVDVTRELEIFACDIAEEAIRLESQPNETYLEAISVKREWIEGRASERDVMIAKDKALRSAERALSEQYLEFYHALRGAVWNAVLTGGSVSGQLVGTLVNACRAIIISEIGPNHYGSKFPQRWKEINAVQNERLKGLLKGVMGEE